MMGKVVLADLFKNLKMDQNIVETTKAKEYLAGHKEFSSDTSIDAAEQIAFDSYGNKVFCVPLDTLEDLYLTNREPVHDAVLPIMSNGLKKLADEIKKETDLICQLEYLIRKIPVQETKLSIQLIEQHLRFSSESGLVRSEEVIFIRSDTPLLALGCYFQSFKLYDCPYIFATNESAAICYLFTELCQKAGLSPVKLVIGEMKALSCSSLKLVTFPKLFNDFVPEVTGIITEKSDMDSAVDIFINSERHPFPLTRIFVQESVYKDFKGILSWKCKSQKNINISFKTNCTEAFKYGAKTFYLDYAGNIEDTKNLKDQVIYIEAYRTVQELHSLLNKAQKHLCMSLWASGVSEANEIALNVITPIIWINDYNNFNGPNEVSQSVFDKTHSSGSIGCDKASLDGLIPLQNSWNKKTFNERYEKVIKAFQEANESLANIIKSKDKSYWQNNDIIVVQNKCMIMKFNLPIPIVNFFWTYELNNDVTHPKMVAIWLSIAKALINGSALAYCISERNDDAKVIINKLTVCGLPVVKILFSGEDSVNLEYKMTFSYYAESVQTKVIWTNFGTTFAN